MPFPANWLEELVVEWLDLEGFAISTSVSVNAGPGGKWVPDVVGAKLDAEGNLIIRHCEATMWLSQGPDKAVKHFEKQFSNDVAKAVRQHFSQIFGDEAAEHAEYEKWLITCAHSAPVESALKERIPEIQIYDLNEFLECDVLGTIKNWKQGRRMMMLPSDKWLLHMIDVMVNRKGWSRRSKNRISG